MKNFRVIVNGNEYNVQIEEVKECSGAIPSVIERKVEKEVKVPVAPRVAPKKPKVGAGAGSNVISAPLPGAILDVKVKVGDSVKKGDTLIILEAMKMENEIMAPGDGTIAEVNIQKGNSVNAGDVLIVLS